MVSGYGGWLITYGKYGKKSVPLLSAYKIIEYCQ